MISSVLVTGGAGYIGSHTVQQLLDCGWPVIVFDNLSTGHRWAVPEGILEVGDLRDEVRLRDVFDRHAISAVIHFAASSLVGESAEQPLAYYDNNLCGTLNLVRACVEAGVDRLVFSSSAAVYGEPEQDPISELAPLVPVNPYGATKAACERLLADAEGAGGPRHVSLRYFNAAGADPQTRMGEAHEPETHLIPRLLQSVSGRADGFTLFGDDYPTADGTCVRDYVHVADLARAHVLALDYLKAGGASLALNCGYGCGFSVRKVVDAVERVTGFKVPLSRGPRRPGDPPRLVADGRALREVLGWAPARDYLETIVRDAWQWEQRMVVEDFSG